MAGARSFVSLTAAVSLAFPIGASADAIQPASAAETPGAFEVIGHDPLMNRGMNAALAMHGDYAYVGSRTDGKQDNINDAGIMVVDVSDPADPQVVRQIGPPWEGNVGESSRELRVWASQEILVVLHTNCSPAIHACLAPASNNFRFYDVSSDNAADPQLILEFDRDTHEFFLWEDPFNSARALLFAAGAGSAMQIYDLSPVLEGAEPKTLYNGPTRYAGGLHSLSVSNDGTCAYFALLDGGFAVADVSDFTSGVDDPQLRRITPNGNRPTWPGPGAHSAVKLWDRDWVYVSDEVYGDALTPAFGQHGCPWGWARMIDISDAEAPSVEAEYRLSENQEDFCTTDPPRPFSAYSAHYPTQTPNIVFTSWHAGGMQAIGVGDPADPVQLAEFRPEPLPFVVQEDPVLSTGQDKVVMWSYPIIKGGLIYVVDVRNGLYVLRYTGPMQDEVDAIGFLEGNSNQGHALCFEPVMLPKENPDDPDVFHLPDYCDE